MSDSTGEIDFNKMDGLVPGIVQDAQTGEVLMLGFLNQVSYAKTLETGGKDAAWCAAALGTPCATRPA